MNDVKLIEAIAAIRTEMRISTHHISTVMIANSSKRARAMLISAGIVAASIAGSTVAMILWGWG